jgi:hypothetical protein
LIPLFDATPARAIKDPSAGYDFGRPQRVKPTQSPPERSNTVPDPNNPGQFGNREDTEEQASKGGHASSGSYGGDNAADPAAAGRAGEQAQPDEAKARGGQHGHGGQGQ